MSKEITDGNGRNRCEVSFSFNKYNKPELVDLKTSIANTIINVLFMVPGNNPTNPNIGVDIRSYFYKDESSISGNEIQSKIIESCGVLPGGASLSSVEFNVVTIEGNTLFVLLARVNIPEEGDTALGVAFKQSKEDKDVINFNFDYVDI